MSQEEAERLLIHHALQEDGAYTRLRMGEDPGIVDTENLMEALRVLRRHFLESDQIPRQIAISCGVILHFQSECQRNLTEAAAPESLIHTVSVLGQEAFNVLTGKLFD